MTSCEVKCFCCLTHTPCCGFAASMGLTTNAALRQQGGHCVLRIRKTHEYSEISEGSEGARKASWRDSVSAEDFGRGEDLKGAGSVPCTGKVGYAISGVNVIIGYNLTNSLNSMSRNKIIATRIHVGGDSVAQSKPTANLYIMAYRKCGYSSSI